MHSSVFVFSNWVSQAFLAFFGKAGSEPVLLAVFGSILFVIASKMRRPMSQLDGDQRMEAGSPVVGTMERIDRVRFVHLHAVRSTETIGIAKQAVSS